MFLGLMALIDPPREAVPGAVHKCKTAGIKVTRIPSFGWAIILFSSEDVYRRLYVVEPNPNEVTIRLMPCFSREVREVMPYNKHDAACTQSHVFRVWYYTVNW